MKGMQRVKLCGKELPCSLGVVLSLKHNVPYIQQPRGSSRLFHLSLHFIDTNDLITVFVQKIN